MAVTTPIVGAIYDAALDARQWPGVLDLIAREFQGTSAHLAVDDVAMAQGWEISSNGPDPKFEQLYADYFAARNVLWQRMVAQNLDQHIMTDRMVMPRAEFERSEFYNDFLKPQGCEEVLISLLVRRSDSGTTLTVWRPAGLGAWQCDDITAVAGLAPHLRRALEINRCTSSAKLEHDLAGEALDRLAHGTILVDRDARVLFANRAAESLLTDGSGLRWEQHRVAAVKATETAMLRRAIAVGAQHRTGSSLTISREARAALRLTIIPRRREDVPWPAAACGAVIFIKDPENAPSPSLTAFARHFNLTPAQTACAREAARGDGLVATARRLGISYGTARSHLLQVFQKTRTTRQAQLIRLILEWSDAPGIGERMLVGGHRPFG